jgi:hypothetical protein
MLPSPGGYTMETKLCVIIIVSISYKSINVLHHMKGKVKEFVLIIDLIASLIIQVNKFNDIKSGSYVQQGYAKAH